MDESCPACGAKLPASACPVCTELGHIEWLRAELRRWYAEGLLPTDRLGLLLSRYELRADELRGPLPELELSATTPPPTTTTPLREPDRPEPIGAVPAAPPPAEPAGPSEWERFQAATNLSWIYGVAVLFITAGLLWLVVVSSDTSWGRFVQAAVVTALGAGALRLGWWVFRELELRTGGQALLAIGVMLTPLALYAIQRAVGGSGGPEFACLLWAVTAALSGWLAMALRLPSQVGLCNVAAALALYCGARSLADEVPLELLGCLFAPLAGANVAWAWRLRGHAARDEQLRPMLTAARVSAVVLVTLASLALAGAIQDLFGPRPNVAELLAPLLVAAVFIAMAHETGRPQLIALGACGWYLCALGIGYGWFGRAPVGEWLAVMGLLGAAAALRDEREEFAAWYLGTGVVASAALLVPRLWRLVEGDLSGWSAVSAWSIAAAYAGMAAAWQRREPLAAAVIVATIATLFTAGVLGFGYTAYPTWLAALAALLAVLARQTRERRWAPHSVGVTIAWWTLVPLVTGLLVGFGAAAADGYSLALTVGLALLAVVSAYVSYLPPERNILYLSVSAAGLAVVLVGSALPWRLDPWAPVALAALALTYAALWGDAHLQPLEVSGVVLATIAAAASATIAAVDGPRAEWAAGAALAATALALPALPAYVARSHLPDLQDRGYRPWAALLAAAAAAGTGTALAGVGAAVGLSLVGLAAEALWFALPSAGCWERPLRSAGLTIATVGGLWAGFAPRASLWLWAALPAQAAILLGAEEDDAIYVLGLAVWLLAGGVAAYEHGGLPGGERWLRYGLLHTVVAIAHLVQARRCAVAAVSGCVIYAVAHCYLGWSWATAHFGLWYGVYAAMVAAVGLGLKAQGLERAGRGAVAVSAVAAVITLVASAVVADVTSTLTLLCAYTAIAGVLAWRGLAEPGWPVGLANLTATYALWYLREPTGELAAAWYGLRLAALALFDVLVAAAVQLRLRWKEALLYAAAFVGVTGALLLFLPPERPAVYGYLLLCAAACTAAWLEGEDRLYDLGFACAWIAMTIVLLDASRGRGELAPYRSLDLYVAPIGLYLLLIAERREGREAGLRLAGAALILASLWVAALAADSPWHDAGLFVAILAAAVYGSSRRDPLVSLSGYGAAALYLVVQVWRWKAGGRLFLTAVLILLGVGALLYALSQERRSSRRE